MPFVLRKVYRRNCYSVKSKKSKRIHAKCTSKKKAQSQIRLLKGIENNPKFRETLRKTRKR